MKKIGELVNGDELICYMRLGLALMRVRRKDGTAYRQVPKKPRRTRSLDLTRFTGIVLENNSTTKVITIMSTVLNSHTIAQSSALEPPLRVDVHYTAFSRVQLLSKFHTPGRTDAFPSRPTSTEGLGTDSKAFRTREDVDIT